MYGGERYNVRTGATEGQVFQRCVTGVCTSVAVISWILILGTYTVEVVFGVWSAVVYVLAENYVLGGVTIACIVPSIIGLSVVSLVWYYDQDKYYNGLKESHPHDQQVQRYSRFLHAGSVIAHVLLVGQLYRYCQLIFLSCSKHSVVDQASLRRDAGLVRFLHGFLFSAPMVAVQLYAVLQLLLSQEDFFRMVQPVTLASLLASALSLLLTLLVYVASDRLHEEGRRVVCVGYVAMFLWHLMMVAARITVLVMFAVKFGPYVAVVVGVHWIAMLIWLLIERTNFCGETTSRPPKRRFYLEIPFAFLLSFVFLFIFFNVKDSSSLVRSIIYHIVTSVETILLASLYYAFMSTHPYTPWLFGFTVGLYLLSVAIMSLYYCAWHPNRTDSCYIVGLPKHCCRCCRRDNDDGPAIGNVDLPLRDASTSSEGGEGRSSPSIRMQETGDAQTSGSDLIQDRLTATPTTISAYNRLNPLRCENHDVSITPISAQLSYSTQSGMLNPQHAVPNGIAGGSSGMTEMPRGTTTIHGTQHLPYFFSSSASVQRSQSHNYPRSHRDTWFQDDRRKSDLPFRSSTPHARTSAPYNSVLGGGAMYTSDYTVTRQHIPQRTDYLSYYNQQTRSYVDQQNDGLRPGSGWSGNESGVTGTSIHRTPSNQYPSRNVTPFPTVQVNGIRDSITELHQPAARPRSYGNTPLHISSAAYSSSPHLRSPADTSSSTNFQFPRPNSRGSHLSSHHNSNTSTHLHPLDTTAGSKRYDIGMSRSRSGGFIPKHSPLTTHRSQRHYSHGPSPTNHTPSSSPYSNRRPHSSVYCREDSTGGLSAPHSMGGYSDPSARSQGRDSRATNDRSTSRSSSSGGDTGYNVRISGTYEPDISCDSHVTSMIGRHGGAPLNSISLQSGGGTLV